MNTHSPARPTLLDRLGGVEGAARLVDAFYAAMQTRDDARTIRAMHDADLGEARRVLAGYLREWLSRAAPATDERGMPALQRRHVPHAIDTAARDAWMACMGDAIDAIGVEPPLRAELLAAFAAVAERMRNQPDRAGEPSGTSH